ncbi:ImmA/IrrE family metallo-endopeptidase [Paenibacillus silviterrae]|nr:ImmA/IrrE family metallo-endopeptidase [Paenibacillus chinjuensis]
MSKATKKRTNSMKKIPMVPRRQFAKQGALVFMERFGIDSLPVNPFVYYKKNNWLLFKLSEAELLYGATDPLRLRATKADAVTVWNGKQYLTIYDDTAGYSSERIRWTLAHEIGHIFLNHLFDYELTSINRGGLTQYQYRTLENEADLFAQELLAPSYVLSKLGATLAADIEFICKISRQAAKYRAQELVRFQRNVDDFGHTFYEKNFAPYFKEVNYCSNIPVPLPNRHIHKVSAEVKYMNVKFMNFQSDSNGRFKMCPRCGHNKFSEKASYCKMCGLFLYNDCQNQLDMPRSNCGEINPPDARYCEACGSETYMSKMGLLKTWREMEAERFRDEEAISRRMSKTVRRF